ncbi:MAG: HAD family hydrolase [Campylobacterota bacterium]
MAHKAVIFDLDGTLLDSIHDIALCCNEVLQRFGYQSHPREAYKDFVADGARVLFERALPSGHTGDELERALTLFRQIYESRVHPNTLPYSGVEDMLATLQQEGLAKSVLSNKPDHTTKAYVQQMLGHYDFAQVWGQQEGYGLKPDPASALQIARNMQRDPGEIIFVGDTATDMKTAKNAGMRSIGVLWGFRNEAELRAGGADMIAATPREVLSLLL